MELPKTAKLAIEKYQELIKTQPQYAEEYRRIITIILKHYNK